MNRVSRVGILAFAASVLVATTGMALAAVPSPSPGGLPSPSPSQMPLPDLTMAPLVTLPPVRPSFLAEPDLPTDGYLLGDPDAPVLIELFEDFQCPYCQRFSLLEAPQLMEDWLRPGYARMVFHDFAFLGEESRWAAVAGRLAAQQDRFWPFHDLLYSNLLGENVGSFTPDRLLLMGRMAGLDMAPFVAGLQVPAARALWATIEQEVRAAANERGVTSTPTILVDGTPVTSPGAATVGAAVRAALAARDAAASPGSSGAPTPSAAADELPVPSGQP